MKNKVKTYLHIAKTASKVFTPYLKKAKKNMFKNRTYDNMLQKIKKAKKNNYKASKSSP